jgi:hypothetical protein
MRRLASGKPLPQWDYSHSIDLPAGKKFTTHSKLQSTPGLCACAQSCIDTCGNCNDCISTVSSGFVTPIFNAWTNTSLASLIPQASLRAALGHA